MEILFVLIPLGIVLLAVAVWAFVWAVRTGQFEDLEGPAWRVILDEDDPRIPREARPPGAAPAGEGTRPDTKDASDTQDQRREG